MRKLIEKVKIWGEKVDMKDGKKDFGPQNRLIKLKIGVMVSGSGFAISSLKSHDH